MKILNKDLKKRIIKLQLTSKEDFWYLTQIIGFEDKVIGTAIRKVKVETGSDKTNIIKKKITIKISVEKVSFEKNSTVLKINGKIVNSNYDDISNGSYQAINLEENDIITIEKKELFNYQLNKLDEATKPDKDNILVCLLDRETAKLAVISKNEIEPITDLEGEVAKKDKRLINIKSNFYGEINKILEELTTTKKLTHIIIGASKIFQGEIEKQLSDKIKKITTFTIINSVSNNGIYEILKNPELQIILKNKNIATNAKLVDDFFVQLSKNSKIAYGMKDIKNATDAGAIEILILTDNLISKLQEKEKYNELNEILKTISNMKGSIKIIESNSESGQKIDSIGGIAAFLKYDIN